MAIEGTRMRFIPTTRVLVEHPIDAKVRVTHDLCVYPNFETMADYLGVLATWKRGRHARNGSIGYVINKAQHIDGKAIVHAVYFPALKHTVLFTGEGLSLYDGDSLYAEGDFDGL